MPSRATAGSAGFDLQAALDAPLTLAPGKLASVPTGVAVKLPQGSVGLLFGRSGLGVKHGVTLSNSVGVIDSDYTGEIFVGLCNVSDEPYTIMPLDRIAQLVVASPLPVTLVASDTLEETERGSGGFGSTGR
ncbi:MAG: dUTP diphosphatase [Clostridia bacterium]|nr:dUTP diphosphatase [Clostridia bacterium]MBR5768976.1 dUTP diphosphatase [Clostridia bacterium]